MISVFELFRIGIGPSSSHTVGPMRAARRFVRQLEDAQLMPFVARLEATLFGSLAFTGKGHGTHVAVMLGLSGEDPETVMPEAAPALVAEIGATRKLTLDGRHAIDFSPERHLRLVFDALPAHPNGLRFEAFDIQGKEIAAETFYSIGGGFIASDTELANPPAENAANEPYPYASADELLALCEKNELSIAELVRRNEASSRSAAAIDAGLDAIAAAMRACIDAGCRNTGTLPGGLNVKRRAANLLGKLDRAAQDNSHMPHEVMDWVSLFAIAVNEENAAGGRVVTAPTNGAAGIVPAVLEYYLRFCPGADQKGVRDFLLTAGAIGGLFKRNASISGAEVGCQGEVGSASSMAAAGLAAALDGTPSQMENAAEIAMEHHLGMTCDPIGGLVQIPCIERNAMGAVKAINAAALALHGDGKHHVSLDAVIKTMRQTGADMMSIYKETSQGGLAVNAVEC
ncbi:MAG: L-serine dehydratase [Alphaproteobacteria bacterium]|nr:L-serine dehydratase [Alphaproteobacteria bacterium]